MFGQIVEVTEPYPYPEVLYESWHGLLTESQLTRYRRYNALLNVNGITALSQGELEGIKDMRKANMAWERKHGIVYVKPFNDGKIPAALTGPVTNDEEAKAFSKKFDEFRAQANADKRMQIQKMVEEKRFRVYRQLERPEPTQKLVWRLCAKDEQPGPVAKTGKRFRSDSPCEFVDLTQDHD